MPLGTLGDHRDDRSSWSPKRERKSGTRRVVEPLRVVDQQEQTGLLAGAAAPRAWRRQPSVVPASIPNRCIGQHLACGAGS